MGSVVEADVTVHAAYNIASRAAPASRHKEKEVDKDSVIDIHLEEAEHSFMKQNGHVISNGRVPLTIDTSCDSECPGSTASDTDSGYEKCINSPTGSPTSSNSDGVASRSGESTTRGNQENDTSIIIVGAKPKDKDKKGCVAKIDPNVIEYEYKSNHSEIKPNSDAPLRGILKNKQTPTAVGFVNLAFDNSEEELSNSRSNSRPNSLLAHELALTVNSNGAGLANGVRGSLASHHLVAKHQPPVEYRARRRRQARFYWVLLALVLVLLVAAVIVIPILWLTQGNKSNVTSSAVNSTTPDPVIGTSPASG